MAIRNILCPLDFSAATGAVFAYAVDLARANGAALHLFHVCEGAAGGALRTGQQPAEAFGMLGIYQREAHMAGIARVSTQVRTGEAAEIVAEAVDCQADVIVIGAHGCTHLTRFLMGSTAEYVLRQAPCMTLLVHERSHPPSASPSVADAASRWAA